ncbi:CHASE2 domain-containing protein [Halomonas sp. THAF12]|uniref:CHASE2 domain-containing protein n=1 Tax=Halomonas sp. B23F22_10 TaxID=3459515 RepID=UPI00373E2C33
MAHVSQSLFRGLTRTWWLVGLLLVTLALWAEQRAWLFDNTLYDRFLTSMTTPASDDILIVNIDERSMEALGRWPWPRSVHADLVDQLASAGASAVLFDVVFAEPARQPEQDQRLARAIKEHGHVFLPAMHVRRSERTDNANRLLPVEPLSDAANGIGHIDVRADVDGAVRSIRLREDGVPQLTLQLYQDLVTQGITTPSDATRRLLADDRRDLEVRIPYHGSTYHYPRVSYVDVLRGRLPGSLLEGRTVMIGTTAKGLGDHHLTPFGAADGGMPGIEILANMLDGLLQGDIIRDLPAGVSSALSLLPLLVFMALVRLFQFRYMAKLAFAVTSLVLLGAWGLLALGWWWPPAVGLLTVIGAYVLISWRCQASALRWFQQEIERLESEPSMIPTPTREQAPEWGLVLHKHLRALDSGITRIRNSRRFITDALDCLPIATMVVDVNGHIILSSAMAKPLLQRCRVDEKGTLHELLNNMVRENLGSAPSQQQQQELSAFDGALYKDPSEHYYHLKVSPLVTAVDAFKVAWLIGFVDVTSERQAEAQRAKLMRFLSHDLKAPQSNILALTQLQNTPSRLPEEALLSQVAQQANKTLSLTESFMQLTQIEFGTQSQEFLLLSDVTLEAIDQAWPTARHRSIHLDYDPQDECPMEGDRTYLLRAIVNLLDNAIKYSPADTRVTIEARDTPSGISLSIRDQGVGIPERDLPHIFDSYRRSSGASLAAGHGLGLSMVKLVVEQHAGSITCESSEHVGTHFLLTFPRAQDDID